MTRETDEQAIRALIDRWMRATAAADIDTVLSLMSDDVVFMVPGREPFGKAEFEANSRAMKDVRIEGRSTPLEIKVLGDWAWLRARIEITISPTDKPTVKRGGYTLTILNKQPDGSWLLVRDANLVG